MIYSDFQGLKLSRLGFGCMRFKTDPATGEIDQETVNRMFDLAIEKGVNYFFEASVGGGIPIIRPLAKCLTGDPVRSDVGLCQSGSRPSYMMASSPYTWPQFRIGMLHFLVASNVARYRAFRSALSLGKTLRWWFSLR